MEYGYLAVEGQHEIEFVGALLKKRGLKRIEQKESVDPFWIRTIPKEFPYQGNLLKRVPIPAFFQDDDISIAVHSCGGFTQVFDRVKMTFINTEALPKKATGIGIIIDADYGVGGAEKRFKSLKSRFEKDLKLKMPDRPGEVLSGRPNSGVYILPNNLDQGTLDTILLECAEKVYPSLLKGAKHYIENLDLKKLNSDDKKQFRKPSGRNKATVGCVGSVLRPGKAIQVSIHDNRWVSAKTLTLEKVSSLKKFLLKLFNLS